MSSGEQGRACEVSVVMGIFATPARYLRPAIQSVLDQTLENFELIIIEDQSDDPAADVIAAFNDRRIRHVVPERKLGLTRALREGMAMARAPLIARLDGDDIARPDRLATQVDFLRAHPETSVVGSGLSIIDESEASIGRRSYPLTHDEIATAMRRYNAMAHPAVMFRKSDVDSVGGYDAEQPLEDYELWCRMIARGYRFANLSEDLVRYRFHGRSLRSTQVRAVIRHTLAVKGRYFAGQFTVGDRLRNLAERLLLLLPAGIVLGLFRKWQYRT